MGGVRLQRQGPFGARHLVEVGGYDEIDQDGDGHHTNAQLDHHDLSASQQAVHRLAGDRHGSEYDEESDYHRDKVLHLGMAIWMQRVGRLHGLPHGIERQDRCEQIGNGIHCLRDDAY